MTDAATTAPPKINRPRFHLWREPATDDDYVGVVAVTNGDQLLAETQAKGLGIQVGKGSGFHLTALWVWAAAVRLEHTTDKFKAFTATYAWEAVEEPKPTTEEGEPEPDPTFGDQAPNTA